MRNWISVLFDASARTGIFYFFEMQYVLEETKILSLNVLNPCAFLCVKQWWIQESKMKDKITKIFLPWLLGALLYDYVFPRRIKWALWCLLHITELCCLVAVSEKLLSSTDVCTAGLWNSLCG